MGESAHAIAIVPHRRLPRRSLRPDASGEGAPPREEAAVLQTGAQRWSDRNGFAAADHSPDTTDSRKCPAEFVVRNHAGSISYRALQRLKEPPPSGHRSDTASAAVLNDVLRDGRDNLRDNYGDNRFRVNRSLSYT